MIRIRRGVALPTLQRQRTEIMNIQVNMDDVVFEGQTLKRPAHISRSSWMQLWESIRDGFIEEE